MSHSDADVAALQAAVSEGHQPWRFDPVEVARAELGADESRAALNLSAADQRELDDSARWQFHDPIATWQGPDHHARVTLQKSGLGPPADQIWIATQVEITP